MKQDKEKFDLILTGAIVDIKEVIKDGKSFGMLKMTLTLIKPVSKTSPQKILFQKEYTKLVDCNTNDAESLVKALSEATKAISAEVIKNVVNTAK